MSEPRRCRAIRDYTAKADDEISFKEGDVVFVPKRVAGDRWQGVLNGQVGWFPKIYVDDTTVEVKAGQPSRVRAIRDVQGDDDTMLSMKKGDVAFVLAKDGKNWKAVFSGKQGLVPADCVEDASEKKIEVKQEPAKCKAIKTHIAKDPNELSFKLGDTVFVPNPDGKLDTWKGVSNNQIGTFPKSYVIDVKSKPEDELTKMLEAAKLDAGEVAALAEFEKLGK